MAEKERSDDAMQTFLRRVWRHDVQPLLRGPRAKQRANAARIVGKAAGLGGTFVDSVLRMRGRPFTRFMTVLGSTFGAMLPDVWSWEWLRSASLEDQHRVEEQVARRAAELAERDALELLELPIDATADEARTRWRELARRWHPDRAEPASRAESQVRFVAYREAYESLCRLKGWERSA